jgi:hypothetical protein
MVFLQSFAYVTLAEQFERAHMVLLLPKAAGDQRSKRMSL